MTLVETIEAHVRALPPALQREALDFIAWLEVRYGIKKPAVPVAAPSSTEEFIARHAGALSDDFPDDIDDSDLTRNIDEFSRVSGLAVENWQS